MALYSLWRGRFFEIAAFQGGTSLRILHKLPRFSEELDFILLQPNASFDWSRYLDPLLTGLTEFGLQSEVLDKSKMDTYLDFPLDFEVCYQDLPSNFALKIHALLCRPYIKGRNWYDFNRYIKQKVSPNLPHLQAALHQFGPWKAPNPVIDTRWVVDRLNEKIATIDWKAAAADVERFLGAADRESLKIWSARFFSTRALAVALLLNPLLLQLRARASRPLSHVIDLTI